MSKIPKEKRYALVEACKKAGIDVTVREAKAPFSEIVLVDENGRKYKVSKDLKVKFTVMDRIDATNPLVDGAILTSNVVNAVCSKQHVVIGTTQRRKAGFRKAKKRIAKFGKLKG